MATPSILIVPDRYKSGVLYSQLPESGAVDFGVTRATTAYRTNASGVLESVASGVPRLDYTGGGCPSLLVEPAATNLALYSQDFRNVAEGGATNTWTPNDTTIISTNNLAPDGTSTATRIKGGAGGNRARQQVSIGTSGAPYSGSIFIRRVSGTTNIQLRVGDVSQLISINPTSNWQRFSHTASPTSTTVRLAIVFANDTDEFEIWGAQLEAGSVATSYIPTVASTVTRNADVISKTGVSGFIGQTEGSVYAEATISNISTGMRIIELSNGSANNRIIVSIQGSILQLLVQNGGVTQATINSSTISAGTFKIAYAYRLDDFVFYINGVQIGTDTSGAVPTLSQINLGSAWNESAATFLNGHIRAAAIYKTRLSNTELAALTTL